MSDINHLGPRYRPNRLTRASREAVRHSAAVPEVASVETIPCASATHVRSPQDRWPATGEWALDAFTMPRITDSVIRWAGCNAIAGACL